MDIENEIKKIQERNRCVEIDKKWETSAIRRIMIAIITFVVALLFLSIIKVENAFLAAFVPMGGFLISTFSIKPARKVWEKMRRNG